MWFGKNKGRKKITNHSVIGITAEGKGRANSYVMAGKPDEVLAVLAERQPLNVADIVEELQLPYQAVINSLEKLQQAGLIKNMDW